MTVKIGISDDYAYLDCGNLEFYYGYEVVEDDSEEELWCFEVKKNGKQIFKKNNNELAKVLKSNDRWLNMEEALLVGIGLYLESSQSKNL